MERSNLSEHRKCVDSATRKIETPERLEKVASPSSFIKNFKERSHSCCEDMVSQSIGREFVVERHSMTAKMMMSTLVGAAIIFFVAMAILISHSSLLECSNNLQCTHIERYPFGIERREALKEMVSAETQWAPGGQQMAVKLVLNHADGSTTDYQGVGTNGEHAQKVARALNAFISAPEATAQFALRAGSVGASILMAALALLGALAVPYFFSKLRLQLHGNVLGAVIERWPIAPRRFQWTLGQPVTLRLERKVSLDQEFFLVMLVVGSQTIDLGLAFRNAPAAQKRLAEINTWLQTAAN